MLLKQTRIYSQIVLNRITLIVGKAIYSGSLTDDICTQCYRCKKFDQSIIHNEKNGKTSANIMKSRSHLFMLTNFSALLLLFCIQEQQPHRIFSSRFTNCRRTKQKPIVGDKWIFLYAHKNDDTHAHGPSEGQKSTFHNVTMLQSTLTHKTRNSNCLWEVAVVVALKQMKSFRN